jgi:catechol 2,3-dioxygenase-like lactoylglutathione lyase family enzyme
MNAARQRGGFHHIAIEVTDMDISIDFYRQLLDLRLTERHEAGELKQIPVALAFLRAQDNHHDLVLAHNPNKKYRKRTAADELEGLPGFHHFAFEFEDREAWLAQLEKVKSLGHDIVRGPIIHSPWHPQGEGSWGENESFYILDPDEHRIEMFCDMATIKKDGSFVDAYGNGIVGAMAEE